MSFPINPSPSQRRLREQIQAASEALSRAKAALEAEVSGTARREVSDAQRGVSEAQVKQILLQAAQKHLALASASALKESAPSGLPGLPGGSQGGADERTARAALGSVWSSLAEFETLRGDKDASIAAYERALEFAPDNAIAHAQLAELLEGRHDIANAKTHAERALAADSANVVAAIALTRVLLREEKFAEAESAALAATEAPSAIVDERAMAWALIGEARDRLDDTQGAFQAFTKANRLMLQAYGAVRDTPHAANPASVRGMTRFVSKIDAGAWRTDVVFSTQTPVFLIGFPRSGTTLLDQVLSSHSAIVCLEEKQYLTDALSAALRSGDSLDRIGVLTPEEIAAIRQAYWRNVSTDNANTADKLVVDRQPMHITLLPMIAKVFPDAKYIFASRDPRDTVLSCYQQSFSVNIMSAQFWDLAHAADYYDAVMELLLACRDVLKLKILDVRYDDVVADLEKEVRRVTDFLGVAFEPAMLRYQDTARKRTISTASARQVINPIYQRSVGRWRRYEHELAPVLPLLNRWAARLGYSV